MSITLNKVINKAWLRFCLLIVLVATIIGIPTAHATNLASPAPARWQANCPPGETEEIFWPNIQTVNPTTPHAGDAVVVSGSGGYIRCSGGLYNESARSFDLTFDGQVIGQFGCYANHCQTTITIPAATSSGSHIIATEGGSEIKINVQPERLVDAVIFLPAVTHGISE